MNKPIALSDLSPAPFAKARRAKTDRAWLKPRPKRRFRLPPQLVALALAIAVPAFAAPSQWKPFDLFGFGQTSGPKPMGFEIAGESFPGSAFYYLTDEPYLPTAMSVAPINGSTAFVNAVPDDGLTGPTARPMFAAGTSIDKARALQCMTLAIYYEAATESDAGQRAVAQVVLNRVAHPAYPNTVCGVVFQGSERSTGCQFSFTCDGSLARSPARKFWDRAQRVAMASLAGAVYRPVGLATHYHTVQIHPYWADSLTNLTTIGAHTFYRWRGAAGLAAAFTDIYTGREPLPARHKPTNAPDPSSIADPIQLARSYEQSLAAAQSAVPAARGVGGVRPAAAPLPPPAYSAEVEARGGEQLYSGNRLPGSGEVKSEYQQSGQWIGKP